MKDIENKPVEFNPQNTFKRELGCFSLRLGKIFFNLSIFFLVLCICGILSLISTVVMIVFGIVVTLATLGTVFVIMPNFWSNLISGINIAGNVSEFLMSNFYIFASIAVACSILSIIISALDKQNKHKGKIVIASIVLAVTIVSIIITMAG